MNNLLGNLLGLFSGPLSGLWAAFADWRFRRALRQGKASAWNVHRQNTEFLERFVETQKVLRRGRERDAEDAGAYYP